MPKPISVPPSLKEVLSSGEEADVEITEVRVVRDQWTPIGTVALGLGLTVVYKDDEYGQLFSIDKEVLSGSVGRILVQAEVEEINDKNAEEEAEKIVGMKVKVKCRGEKLYWYPEK